MMHITAASANQSCNETEPQWSPGGNEIAFLSDAQTPNLIAICNELQLSIAQQEKHNR